MRSRPARNAPRTVGATYPLLAALGLGALFALSALVLPRGVAAASQTSKRTTVRTPTAAFVLRSQSQWVLAPSGASNSTGSSGSSVLVRPSPFDLVLGVRHAPAGTLVEASLYPRLGTRFDFERAARNGPRGTPISTTAPIPLAHLPADPRAAGGVSLALSVVQTSAIGQGERLGLSCGLLTAGTCTGVYPVVVALESGAGRVLHHFTTFLTYVTAKSTHPLNFAWLVPVQAPVALVPHPSKPTRAIAPISRHDAASLESLIADVRASPSVPVTFDPSPETLQALGAAGPAGRAAITSLAALSQSQDTDQVLSPSYVPVDLGALEGAGEPTEIVAQMAAGATVLRHLHVRTTASSAWVQTGPVGNEIAGGLARVGATRFVLPNVDLAPTANATSAGTWASTFSLALSRGKSTTSIESAETDSWLDGQFSSLHDDPALAATQFLADLAMVHFERPDTTAVRGMVGLPSTHWVATPVFDRVLLGGLTQNPVVAPVTLSEFFSSVTDEGARELLTTGPGPHLRHGLAKRMSTDRVRLSNFDDAVGGHPRPAVLGELDDLLLSAESDELSPSRQVAGLAGFATVLTRQVHLVKFATEQTFTLTARTGAIPITIESGAPYLVFGTLSVNGNKFLFPHGGTRRSVRLDHATNTKRVYVEVRTSGDLPLHVEFTSPNGQLTFAARVLTVRSTATSVVGVVLTLLALATLLTWWARTWWSGRRKRHLGAGAPPAGAATT